MDLIADKSGNTIKKRNSLKHQQIGNESPSNSDNIINESLSKNDNGFATPKSNKISFNRTSTGQYLQISIMNPATLDDSDSDSDDHSGSKKSKNSKLHLFDRSNIPSIRGSKRYLIKRYNSSSRRNQLMNGCCMFLLKLLCSIWCLICSWFMFIGIIFGAYRCFTAMDEIPIAPAAFIGIMALVLLCCCGCCVISTWLAIDQLRNQKKNTYHIKYCCDYLRGKDKDKYYKRQWTQTIREVDKIDYFMCYYARKYSLIFNDHIYEILYEYNGKDYLIDHY